MNRYSEGNKKKWVHVSPEDRTRMMSELAKKRAQKMTPDERTAHAKMMRSMVGKKVV